MKIALVGKMRSGKDTVAKYFMREEDALKINFGDGIKDIAREYFPDLYAKGKPRKLLQEIGQMFRKHDPAVWINNLDRDLRVSEWFEEADTFSIVVADLRQMNEYEYLKSKGFHIIKVDSSDEIRKERIIKSKDSFIESDFYHETELSVDSIPFDFLITNDGTYEELTEQIVKIHKEIKEKEEERQT